MAKTLHNDVFDGALNIIKNNCTRMTLCEGQPTTFAEGNTTFALADVTMAPADYTIADGDTSGRKLTVAAKNAVPVDISGDGNHVAHLDVTNSKLLAVTTCPTVSVTAGGTVDLAAHKLELADPA